MTGRTIVAVGGGGFSGAGLVFRGTELAEIVSERAEARGYRVERGPDGGAVETALETRVIG